MLPPFHPSPRRRSTTLATALLAALRLPWVADIPPMKWLRAAPRPSSSPLLVIERFPFSGYESLIAGRLSGCVSRRQEKHLGNTYIEACFSLLHFPSSLHSSFPLPSLLTRFFVSRFLYPVPPRSVFPLFFCSLSLSLSLALFLSSARVRAAVRSL